MSSTPAGQFVHSQLPAQGLKLTIGFHFGCFCVCELHRAWAGVICCMKIGFPPS
jgi:hypothetical protein